MIHKRRPHSWSLLLHEIALPLKSPTGSLGWRKAGGPPTPQVHRRPFSLPCPSSQGLTSGLLNTSQRSLWRWLVW